MNTLGKTEVDYIKYLYVNKDKYVKPDVRKVVSIYNLYMPDRKHIFHKLSENMCSCNLRPYLIQLYRKMEKDGLFNVSNEEERSAEPLKKNSTKKKNSKQSPASK